LKDLTLEGYTGDAIKVEAEEVAEGSDGGLKVVERREEDILHRGVVEIN
jgi:hypothetical protein